MRNRAKCTNCGDIIESYHSSDYIQCKCGDIAVDGGEAMKCFAKDWNQFKRVDDEGNELIVQVKEKGKIDEIELAPILKRAEMIDMLSEYVKSYEHLPEQAMRSPVSHADLVSALLLVLAIFRNE